MLLIGNTFTYSYLASFQTLFLIFIRFCLWQWIFAIKLYLRLVFLPFLSSFFSYFYITIKEAEVLSSLYVLRYPIYISINVSIGIPYWLPLAHICPGKSHLLIFPVNFSVYLHFYEVSIIECLLKHFCFRYSLQKFSSFLYRTDYWA